MLGTQPRIWTSLSSPCPGGIPGRGGRWERGAKGSRGHGRQGRGLDCLALDPSGPRALVSSSVGWGQSYRVGLCTDLVA